MNEKNIINDVESAVRGINKFMYFSWNFKQIYVEWGDMFGHIHHEYMPEFIWECRDKWNCSFDHIVGKWHGIREDTDSHALIPRFYGQMGPHNRRVMLEWIMQNYNDELSL